MKLPEKDSTTWRLLVTTFDVVAGGAVLWFTSPDFREVITRCWNDIVIWLPVATATASGVRNKFFRKDTKDY